MASQAEDFLTPLLPPQVRSIAIGFSGGADSFALLHMAMQWARGRDVAVHAFTVDHGLRKESAGEAAMLHDWCAANGIPHRVLPWEGPKPTSAIQDRARVARDQPR